MKPIKNLLKKVGKFDCIDNRLNLEYEHMCEIQGQTLSNQTLFEYLWCLYPNIHDRCSSIISHLSIMFALAIFIFGRFIEKELYLLAILALADVLLYLIVLLISLRSIRSFGLKSDIKSSSDYLCKFHEEIVFKFTLVELMNKSTAIGMLYSFFLLFLLLAV